MKMKGKKKRCQNKENGKKGAVKFVLLPFLVFDGYFFENVILYNYMNVLF